MESESGEAARERLWCRLRGRESLESFVQLLVLPSRDASCSKADDAQRKRVWLKRKPRNRLLSRSRVSLCAPTLAFLSSRASLITRFAVSCLS